MKIIIDRDSICMGDDFCHQQVIDCNENETIESFINKILKSNFFPVEELKFMVRKWELNIYNKKILTFFPNNNKIKYHIDKNIEIKNIEKNLLFFTYYNNPCAHLIILLKFIYLIYIYIKKQKWTHIVAPLHLLFILFFVIAIIRDILISDFYYSYLTILCGAALCPYLVCITIIIIILLKILSLKFKNIDKIYNKILLHNPFYNFLWLLGMLTLLYSTYMFFSLFLFDYFSSFNLIGIISA